MYDGHMQWIEQDDDDPPQRLRCQKGHFLPRDPTHIQVLTSYEDGPYTVPYMERDTIANKDILDYIWLCKCGWTQKDS